MARSQNGGAATYPPKKRAQRSIHLPSQLGSLQKLESLHCSRNLLTALPASMGHLPRLKLLVCASNKIDRLPDELQVCPLITYLM